MLIQVGVFQLHGKNETKAMDFVSGLLSRRKFLDTWKRLYVHTHTHTDTHLSVLSMGW